MDTAGPHRPYHQFFGTVADRLLGSKCPDLAEPNSRLVRTHVFQLITVMREILWRYNICCNALANNLRALDPGYGQFILETVISCFSGTEHRQPGTPFTLHCRLYPRSHVLELIKPKNWSILPTKLVATATSVEGSKKNNFRVTCPWTSDCDVQQRVTRLRDSLG